jgi:hypothetical protein
MKFHLLPCTLLLVLATCTSFADDSKPPFDRSQAQLAPLPLPNPSDKLIAIEEVVGPESLDWGALADAVAVDLDANDFPERSDAAMAMGVKIADGIVAIKAQNVEMLNNSATALESLGKNLGASDEDLHRARQVRDLANRGEWLMVFLELGFLQTDILRKLNSADNQNERVLIIAAGWLQGARYATSLILSNYSPEISNILREPILAAELSKQLAALPESLQESEKVRQISRAVAEAAVIVDVPLDAPIERDQVERLKSLGDAIVGTITTK